MVSFRTEVGGAIVSSVVMAYVFLGGMRGTAWVNALQTTLFLLFGTIAVFVIGAGMGGFREAMEALLASPATSPLLTRERISPLYLFQLHVHPALVDCFSPHLHLLPHGSRCAVPPARPSCSIRSACCSSGCHRCFWALWRIRRQPFRPFRQSSRRARKLATQSATLTPEDRARLRAQAAGDDVILRLVEGYAPIWLAALLGAAVMAAVMASDSQILALSTMFTEDIFAFYQGTQRFGAPACK